MQDTKTILENMMMKNTKKIQEAMMKKNTKTILEAMIVKKTIQEVLTEIETNQGQDMSEMKI